MTHGTNAGAKGKVSVDFPDEGDDGTASIAGVPPLQMARRVAAVSTSALRCERHLMKKIAGMIGCRSHFHRDGHL
jgi:hypothetical protein